MLFRSAPARAFADYMKAAVANRPVEQFDTQVTLPEWQLEPDDEAYYGQPDNGIPTVDENGQVIQQGGDDQGQPMSDGGDQGFPQQQQQQSPQPQGRRQQQPQDNDWQGPPPPPQPSQRLDQNWLNGVLGRKGNSPQQQPHD